MHSSVLNHLGDDEARGLTIFLTAMIALEESISRVITQYFAPQRSREFTAAFLDGMTMGRKLTVLKVLVRNGFAPDHMDELRQLRDLRNAVAHSLPKEGLFDRRYSVRDTHVGMDDLTVMAERALVLSSELAAAWLV